MVATEISYVQSATLLSNTKVLTVILIRGLVFKDITRIMPLHAKRSSHVGRRHAGGTYAPINCQYIAISLYEIISVKGHLRR